MFEFVGLYWHYLSIILLRKKFVCNTAQLDALHTAHLASLHATYPLMQRSPHLQAGNRVYESNLSALDLLGSQPQILGKCLTLGNFISNLS